MAPISMDGRKLQDACTSAGCLVHSNLFSALPGHHELKARCDSWGGVPVIYWGAVYLWLMLPKLCPFPYNVPKVACIAFWLPPWFLSAPRPSPCFQLFASLAPFSDCFFCDLEKGLPVTHWFYQRVFPFYHGHPITCTAFTTAFRIWAVKCNAPFSSSKTSLKNRRQNVTVFLRLFRLFCISVYQKHA